VTAHLLTNFDECRDDFDTCRHYSDNILSGFTEVSDLRDVFDGESVWSISCVLCSWKTGLRDFRDLWEDGECSGVYL